MTRRTERSVIHTDVEAEATRSSDGADTVTLRLGYANSAKHPTTQTVHLTDTAARNLYAALFLALTKEPGWSR
ncbi:hypothetical protein [Amycolatopsis sp.]|uniref:hypothetical protein n=1 Tax=Amycolatopsis sp. TaxID=37632 RepID=UPI002C970A33|nr:hypothetical protein [Amycolatopsis sp.]HVV11615.1 hypothetical protein [Amycolatopsis sp.]